MVLYLFDDYFDSVLASGKYYIKKTILASLGVYQTLCFPNGSAVKNLLAMQETQIWSLGQEDPLEEGMATHSITLA